MKPKWNIQKINSQSLWCRGEHCGGKGEPLNTEADTQGNKGRRSDGDRDWGKGKERKDMGNLRYAVVWRFL